MGGRGRVGAAAMAAGALARRPDLWPTALRQARRLAPRRWWARPPFLPVPDRRWLRVRALTQYGDAGHTPAPGDVVTFLEWVRGADAARNRPGSARTEK